MKKKRRCYEFRMFFFILAEGSLSVPIKPRVRCTELYKVIVLIKNASQILQLKDGVQIHTIRCVPTYDNSYCLKFNEIPKYWKTYQPCRWNRKIDVINCPIYRRFEGFYDYFNWNLETSTVRIRGVVPVLTDVGKEKLASFTTKRANITPLFKCNNGGKISSDHAMFKKVSSEDTSKAVIH